MSSDPLTGDITEADFFEIDLPVGIRFVLENKQKNEPTRHIEKLAPT